MPTFRPRARLAAVTAAALIVDALIATSTAMSAYVNSSSGLSAAVSGNSWPTVSRPTMPSPQWVQVDLGSAQSAGRVVLQLPASWGARDQTLLLVGEQHRDADVRCDEPVVLAGECNSEHRPAGQVSEFQVWAS